MYGGFSYGVPGYGAGPHNFPEPSEVTVSAIPAGQQMRTWNLTSKVCINNLGVKADDKEELETIFAKFGKINSLFVSSNAPGFAMVEFDDEHAANRAIRELDGSSMNGAHAIVDIAKDLSKSLDRNDRVPFGPPGRPRNSAGFGRTSPVDDNRDRGLRKEFRDAKDRSDRDQGRGLDRDRGRGLDRGRERGVGLERGLDRALDRNRGSDRDRSSTRGSDRSNDRSRGNDRDRDPGNDRSRDTDRSRGNDRGNDRDRSQRGSDRFSQHDDRR